MPEVFAALDTLVAEGQLRHYGVSVERGDEALTAITYPNVQSVQIIFNMLRLRGHRTILGKLYAKGLKNNYLSRSVDGV